MGAVDWSSFLDKVCVFIAAATSLQYAGTPRALWQSSAMEADAADPYSEIRIYGGGIPPVPTPLVSLQCRTVGTSVAAAMARASAIYNCFVDANGAPKRMAIITAGVLRANAIDPKQPPSFLSRDDRGRAEIIFNVEMRLVAL